jgi:hypothetical protein
LSISLGPKSNGELGMHIVCISGNQNRNCRLWPSVAMLSAAMRVQCPLRKSTAQPATHLMAPLSLRFQFRWLGPASSRSTWKPRKFEAALPKQRAIGEGRVPAFLFLRNELGANRGETFERAGQMARLKPARVRELWKKLQRFPEGLWAAVLTPHRDRRPRSFLEGRPEIADLAAGVILERRNHVSNSAVWTVVQAKFGLDSRHRKAVERWCRKFRAKHRATITIATNPDRAKSLYMPAHGRSDEDVCDFMEESQLDGSPSDTFTVMTRAGRMRIIAMIDTFARWPVAIVAPVESADFSGLLLIKANRQIGVWRRIKTDHGSGFISARNRVFLTSIGVECLEIVAPYSGYRKPIIEAFFRGLQRFLELTFGFAGHDVAQRRALRGYYSMADRRGKSEAQLLGARHTPEELEQLIDHWIDKVYLHTPHAGLGGLTPYQKREKWLAEGGTVRRIEDESALYSLLQRRGTRRIQKKCLKIDGAIYTAPELAAYPDIEVDYSYLPDAGKLAIFLKDDPATFLAIAVNDSLLGSIERQARALEAGEHYKEFTANVRKTARRLVKKLDGESPAEILLSASTHNGRTEIATIPFSTPALEASARANQAAAAIQVSPKSLSRNVFPLPVERRAEDLADRRRANYERLKQMPASELTKKQEEWLAIFEHFDLAGISLGKAL